MKRPPKPPDTPGLFDLPLDSVEKQLAAGPTTDEASFTARDPVEPSLASFSGRLVAGLIDVGVVAGVALTIALGTSAMGVELMLEDWPALLVFLLSFSFLYQVPPLAFWGRTPGMAWARLVVRARPNQPLTFQQAIIRWLGSLLTLAALGLPLLLTFAGASLSDRLSRSSTLSTG